VQLLRGRKNGVDALVISPDSRFVVATQVETGSCHLWDLDHPHLKARLLGGADDPVSDATFTSPTALFALQSLRGPHWVRHDPVTGARAPLPWPNRDVTGYGIVHPNGTHLKVSSYHAVSSDFDGVDEYEVDLVTLKVTADSLELGAPAKRVPCPVSLIAFDPSGERYLTHEGYGGSPSLRDASTDTVVATFDTNPNAFVLGTDMWAFTPDGRRLLAVTDNDMVAYDCRVGGPPTARFTPPSGIKLHALAVHPDGRRVATVEDGRTVTLRDADTLQPLRSYDFAMPRVTCVAFTPDGTRCVIGNSRGKVLLFDVE